MELIDRLMVVGMVVGVLIMTMTYTYTVSKRVAHVESVTFGGDRCPKVSA